MTKYFDEEAIIELIKKGMPVNDAIKKVAFSKFGFDKEENDKIEDCHYEYIDLVFPPDSNPPIRNSIKKMTLSVLNFIPLK